MVSAPGPTSRVLLLRLTSGASVVCVRAWCVCVCPEVTVVTPSGLNDQRKLALAFRSGPRDRGCWWGAACGSGDTKLTGTVQGSAHDAGHGTAAGSVGAQRAPGAPPARPSGTWLLPRAPGTWVCRGRQARGCAPSLPPVCTGSHSPVSRPGQQCATWPHSTRPPSLSLHHAFHAL